MALQIGSVPQLFLDDRMIARMEGCRRQFHRPTRWSGNPVIKAEEAWEAGPARNGAYLFGGTVLYDEADRLYKMWYRTSEVSTDVDRPGAGAVVNSIDGPVPYGGYRSCYAVSNDGLIWEKPNLGLVEYAGSRRTNILPPGSGATGFIRRPNLILDYDDPDPARRYRLAYADRVDGRWLLRVAHSPDGIRWDMPTAGGAVLGPQPPYYPLGILMGWDPMSRRFLHVHRKVADGLRVDVDGRAVRAEDGLAISTSPDFESWEHTADVAFSDPRIDPPSWDVGHPGMLAAMPYTGDLFVGFLDTCSTFMVEDLPDADWASTQTDHAEHSPELVISRDGLDWRRIAPHWNLLGRGLPGTWDSEFVVLSKPIVRDDDMLLYYTGRNLTCGVQHVRHPQFGLLGQVVNGVRMGSAIGLATLRRDGFASIDGYDPAGVLSTVPLVFSGDRLVINARAPERAFGATAGGAPFGRLAVEIADRDGRPIDGLRAGECDWFTGDSVRHVITWKGSWDLSRLAGEPVRLNFHLQNAALYAFQFRGDEAPATEVNLLAPGARGRPGH